MATKQLCVHCAGQSLIHDQTPYYSPFHTNLYDVDVMNRIKLTLTSQKKKGKNNAPCVHKAENSGLGSS